MSFQTFYGRMHLFWAFTWNFPAREFWVSFLESLPSLVPSGVHLYNAHFLALQQATELSFVFQGAGFLIGTLRQMKQKWVPWAVPLKAKILDVCFTSSSNREAISRVFPIISSAGLWEGLMQLKRNGFSYPLQCGYSYLWACQGYCNFAIHFWRSHKGFLKHILLLSCYLCGRTSFMFWHLAAIICNMFFKLKAK